MRVRFNRLAISSPEAACRFRRGLRRAEGPHHSRRSLTVVLRPLRPWRGVRATWFPACRRRQHATSMNRSHPNPSVDCLFPSPKAALISS